MLPPIFIMCNPEKEPIRYQSLLRQFERAGIPKGAYEFVHDVWGTDLTSKEYFEFYDPFKPRYGFSTALCWKAAALTPGEVSLMRTFRLVIEKALATGADSVLVFESDIFLRGDFLERFAQVCKELEGDEAWDYVSLGEGVWTRPKGREVASYFDETKLYPPFHQWVFRCCDSMLLRRKFLERLQKTFTPWRECLDWEMNFQMLLHRGKSLWADPPLCEPGTGRHRYGSSLPS